MPSPLVPFPVRRRSLTAAHLAASLSLGFAVVLAGAAAAGQTEAPTPAPGQSVPAHAAGGWPTETTGDDKKPPRTPEQQARLDAVAGELKRLANEFGPDSVVLQAKLLMRAIAAGALGPTAVRVAGPSPAAGPGHLEIDIETGLFFDEKTTTADSRRDAVWKDVAAPVLDEMVSFKIEPSALELVFLFDVQDIAAGSAAVLDPSAAARSEVFRARISREVLEGAIDDRLVGDALREKVEFTPAVTVAQPEPERAP